MRSIEAEGNTIDDAIAKALEELQVERDRVEIEILADATRGLFGLGGKKARVRATMRAPVWGTEEGVARQGTRAIRSAGRRPERPARRRGRSEVGQHSEADSRSGTSRGVNEAVEEQPVAEGNRFEGQEPPLRPVPPEAADRGVELLGRALELMGIQASVEREPGAAEDEVVLQVDGEASAVVIGRHGQALDAIEYIVNRMVAREFPNIGHIIVDAASYRARRRQSLTDMALRLAEKAKRERRTVTLNPLSPRDRRVVHMALRDDRGVSTRSHGVGLHRKLLIIPGNHGRRQGGGMSRQR